VSNRVDDIKPGTSGKPVPGYSVKIVGEDGNTVPAGEVGILWVKGSNALLLEQSGKTRATMAGEWLNTGDMYYVDSEGYVNAGRATIC
jgi:acyl-coenzyme A synthetase/AMP-(fatty) acid ligase